MFKKILILACASMFILTMVACSGTEEEEEDLGAIEAKPWAIAIDYGYPDEMESTEATEVPTEAPTEPPTEAPTEPLTEAPTEAPTEEPTMQVVGHYDGKTEMIDENGKIIIIEDAPEQPADQVDPKLSEDTGSSGNGSGTGSGESSDTGKNNNSNKKNNNSNKNTTPTTPNASDKNKNDSNKSSKPGN